MPRLACIRPNSSNVEEFISSWMAFGSIFISVLAVGDFKVLKPSSPVSLTRTSPSQVWTLVFFTLQLLLPAKDVPYAELYAACPTMVGFWPDSNTPEPSAWCRNAARSFARSNAGAGAAAATLTCMIVRVLGP